MSTKIVTLKSLLKSPGIQSKLNEVLDKRAAQFASSLVAIAQSSKLLEAADPMTLITAGMQAALLDLPVNQSLGFAYIVPYKRQAQFQLGYKGLIQLALRTGQYTALNSMVVKAGQLKSYNELTGVLELDLSMEPEDPYETPDGYAFYFKLSNGFEKTAFWSFAKVRAHAEKYSQSFRKKQGPWTDSFDEMALKTVIKNTLTRYGILSIEMQKATVIDQATVDLEGNVIEYPDNKEDYESTFDVETEETEEDPEPKEPKETTKKTKEKF